MKKRVHKYNFKGGKDANDMVMRKLALNFLQHGSMITTEKKGKALSSYMGRIVEKAKTNTQANKNYLLQEISSEKAIARLFDSVGPTFRGISGGYLTLKRMQQRISDGAMMVKVAWAKAVPVDEVMPKEKKTATQTAESTTKVAPKKGVKKSSHSDKNKKE